MAWRNRWSTAIRLLAPLLFLALALVVQEALGANARRTGRIRDTPFSQAADVRSIPNCHAELFIFDKPCLDFFYTPNNNDTIKVTVACLMAPPKVGEHAWLQESLTCALDAGNCGSYTEKQRPSNTRLPGEWQSKQSAVDRLHSYRPSFLSADSRSGNLGRGCRNGDRAAQIIVWGRHLQQ